MTRSSRKADDRPAFMFYPKDWLTDAGLQACKLSTIGLWINIISFMWLAEERGKISMQTVQDLCKINASDMQTFCADLIKNKVCEVSGKGKNRSLINRKMYRAWLAEASTSEKRRQAAYAKWGAKPKQKYGASIPIPIPIANTVIQEGKENCLNKNPDPEAGGNFNQPVKLGQVFKNLKIPLDNQQG